MTGFESADRSSATSRDWAGLWVLALSLGMIVLDGTIVGVALPTIIADLRLDLVGAQWVNSLYSVVFAALLVTVGRAGDRWGRRRLLVIGLVVFTLGSIAAGVAAGVGPLLLARAVQGVGGAMVLPSTLSTVNATFRGKDRATAFGVWGAVMSGAAALGPLLGGWLTQEWGWRVVFWVNVPVGVALVVATLLLVDETKVQRTQREGTMSSPRSVDVAGPVLSAMGFGTAVFGLIEGTTLGWWTPKQDWAVLGFDWPSTAPLSPVPVAFLIAVVCLSGFVLWETLLSRRGIPGVIDLSLFRIPTFTLGIGTAGLVAVGEFSLLFVLPLHLVDVLGLDTLGAGAVLASMALGAFASGALARRLASLIGPSRVVLVGLGLEVLGAAVTAAVTATSGAPLLMAVVLLPYGLGLGLASAQLTSVSLADIPAARSGVGSATQSTVRQLGSALGTAVGGSALAAFLPSGAALMGPDAAAAGGASLLITAGLLLVACVASWGLDTVVFREERTGTTRSAVPTHR